MPIKTKSSLDFKAALFGVLLVVVILAMSVLSVMLIAFPDGLALADSTNGVVENNFILNSSFSDFSNWSVAGASVSSYNPLVFSATGAWGSIYQILPYQELINQTVTLTVRFRKVSGSSSAVCNLRYRLEGQSSTTGLQSISTASTDYVLRSQTYDLSELVNLSYLQVSIYGQTSGTQVEVDFVKLEIGSTFTGYVQKDYTNYGYDQGVRYGLDNSVSLQGYTLIGNRNDLGDGSIFTLDGRSYTYGTYTEDTRSLYGYNSPNYFVYDSLDGAVAGTQIGFKFVSDLSYGNILITVPVADDYFTVVFEDTVTGDILYISDKDTLHWKTIGQNGVILGTWISEWVNITFFSPNIQNIYFISNWFRSNDSAWNEDPFYFVGDTPLFAIYSTTSDTALTSFDEGFQEGVKQGRESAIYENANNVASARAEGYERGRREAFADANDYSFMGLISSVIDAPIASFRGLLNFSILGVNMQNFVLGILTLCVLLIIIKIAIGSGG